MNFAKSSAYLIGVNIALSVLSALNFFFLAAKLPPVQLGILSILLTIPIVGMILLNVGYSKAAIYYIGRQRFSLETVITNGFIICILLELPLCLSLFAVRNYHHHLFPDISFDLLCLAVVSTPIQIFFVYLTEACLAANRITITLWARILSTIIYVVGCLLIGVTNELTAGKAFVLNFLGIFSSTLLGLIWVVATSPKARLFIPNFQAAISCLEFGGKAQVGEIAQYLAIRLDLILVGAWVGMEVSGYYSLATRIAETIWLMAHSVQLALSAKVAQGIEDSISSKGHRLERTVRYMTAGSVVVSVGAIGVSYLVFKFILTQYQPTFRLLLVLIPGQIALAIFLLLIANLLGDGDPLLATKIRLGMFAISALLYLLLIPLGGAIGAGVATSVAYLVSTLITAIILADKYHIRLPDFLLWKREDREFIRASKQYLRKYFAV